MRNLLLGSAALALSALGCQPSPSPAAAADPAPPDPGAADPGAAEPGAETPDGTSGGYSPCAGKACGATCTACPPGDPDCVETMVIKACDKSGQCVAAPADCP